MAEPYRLEVVSPERLLLSEDVEAVVVPGTDGEMTAMALHMPLLTTMKAGIVTVTLTDASERRYFVRGGFADIGPHAITILAEEAKAVEDIDRADLDQAIKNAGEDVADAADGPTKDAAEQRLAELREVADSLHAAGIGH